MFTLIIKNVVFLRAVRLIVSSGNKDVRITASVLSGINIFMLFICGNVSRLYGFIDKCINNFKRNGRCRISNQSNRRQLRNVSGA